MSHEFHQPSIYQDTCTDGIEDAVDDQSLLAVWSEGSGDTETDGNGNRSSDAVRTTKGPRHPPFAARPVCSCETRTKPETFERLVEDENNVEDVEVGAGNSKCETDENGMKDDTKFKDEDRSHLSCKVVIIIKVFTLMAEVVLTTWWIAEVVFSPWNAASSRLL